MTAAKAYFNNKEVLIHNFTEVITNLLPTSHDSSQTRSQFLEVLLPQIANPGIDPKYRNELLSAISLVLEAQQSEESSILNGYF